MRLTRLERAFRWAATIAVGYLVSRHVRLAREFRGQQLSERADPIVSSAPVNEPAPGAESSRMYRFLKWFVDKMLPTVIVSISIFVATMFFTSAQNSATRDAARQNSLTSLRISNLETIRRASQEPSNGQDRLFTSIYISGSNLSGINLSAFMLDHADLSKTVGSYVNLTGTMLNFASLDSANISASRLLDARFRCASLHNARFTGLVTDELDQYGLIDLSGADLSGASIDLRRVIFWPATVLNNWKIQLGYTDLRGADLSNIPRETIVGAEYTQYDESTRWPVGYHPPSGETQSGNKEQRTNLCNKLKSAGILAGAVQ